MISIRFPIRDVGGGGDGKGETLPCEFGQENPWLDGPITGGFWGGSQLKPQGDLMSACL